MEEQIKDVFFSIIVSAYNVEATIEECLSSILNQSFTNFEVIVVNDCSTDGTFKKIQKYANTDDRISIINHEENRGLLEVRYSGCLAANGEYFLFLDGDDYYLSEALMRIHSVLLEHKEDILEFGYLKVPENTKVNCNSDYACLPDGILDNRYPHTVWNKCYSKKVIKEAIALFAPFYCNMSEDEFYSFAFSFVAKDYSRIDDCIYCYRTGTGMSTSGILTRESIKKNIASIDAKTKALNAFVSKNCPHLLNKVLAAQNNDLEYIAEIVLTSKNSLKEKRVLLKMIDESCGTGFEKKYKRTLSYSHELARFLFK